MKKTNTTNYCFNKLSIVLAFLFVSAVARGQVDNKIELTYEGSTISDATQTSTFADEVSAALTGDTLMLDVTAIPGNDTIYMIELTNAIDISGDPNIFAKIGSNAQMKYMGVILEDINGNSTTGNTGTDQFFLPGKADTSVYLSFSDGSNNQASVQDELTANGVDGTQIKKIIFVNHSGGAYTGQIWFENLQLGTDPTDNGVVKTDTTISMPFNGKRMFGNGLAAIGMDSWMKAGIVQDDALYISPNERLGAHSYMTAFIFDPLLDLSNGNAVFDLKMKSDVDIQLLFRFEDVNGKRVDLVDVYPAISNDFESYHFDVNHRLTSNPDFDPSQIKEFHIRKISDKGVNGTVVVDELNIGMPYFSQYENDYSGTDMSDMYQTTTVAPEVTASQANGVLELDVNNLDDSDTLYAIEFKRPIDISEDPNIWARIKSDAAMEFLGVRLVDVNGNYTSGTNKREVFYLPAENKFLNYSFSDGSNNIMSVQNELDKHNVDGTEITKLIFFNNSGAAFTGKIWFDHIRLSTNNTNNGVVLTDTTFYNPFDGERMFGNGLAAIAMDNNGQIGIAQDDVLHVSMTERLGEHSYLTVFVFEDTLDLSKGNSNVMFKMKSDIEVDLLLRYEDFNGERVDLHNFITTVSDDYVTYAFDLNHRFTSNPSFKPDQIKEFHFRKLSTDPFNGTLIMDDFQLGFVDNEAPEAPANLIISEMTDTTATLSWDEAVDNYGVFEYKIYVNGEYRSSTYNSLRKVYDLDGVTTFTVTAVDRAGNESVMSNEVSETFTVTNVKNILSAKDINTYPNPVTNSLTIQSLHSVNSVKIFSAAGELKLTYQSENADSKRVEINTSSLNNGIYLIKVETDAGIIVKKMVK
jgi:hypothetical protein